MHFKHLILTLLIVLVSSCQEQQSEFVRLNGYTMGTTYQITLKKNSVNVEQLKDAIDNRLAQINRLMSTYIDDSELSIFNATATTDCQELSQDTLRVIKTALDISRMTEGKFDVTLAPLIETWGFDKKETFDEIPDQETINNLRDNIGYGKLTLEDNCVAKKLPELSINLSAIAKGYAVDEIAELIVTYDIKNYLVEVGGEIANKGVNARGKPWTIAIESASTQRRSIQRAIMPKGLGLATSGDYRNYFEKEDKRFSHTIDPTTGYPITHRLASVTVMHQKTMIADALATAMMVMGPQQSLEFADKNQIPIFMLIKGEQGFNEVYSQAFAAYID